jgi:hypothetical protein
MKGMNDFLKKHSYLVVLISALAIIGAIAELIVQLNGTTSPFSWLTGGTHPQAASTVATAPAPAPAPRVSITLQKTKKGNTLWVQWQNLPNTTVALNILRGKTGTDSAGWNIWNTIPIAPGSAVNGFLQLNLGRITEAGYSFEVQAVSSTGGGGMPGSGNGAGPSLVLWTSSSTVPTGTSSAPADLTTSTTNNTTGTSPSTTSSTSGNASSSATTTPSSTSSTTSSTSGNASSSATTTPSSTSSTTSSTSGNASSSAPSETPYYTPQLQVETYGTTNNGTFWAENQNQGILIGWQNLPSATIRITVTRSESTNGPWATILSQNNPGPSGSDNLQIIDSTIGTPYYYEMTATQSTGGSISYGPVYVPAP